MNLSAAIFHDLSCPSCGAPDLETVDERVVCGYCHSEFAGQRSFCANCQHVNREGAEFCEMCGDPLARSCPSCREKNWIGAEYCANCGQPLDILEYLYRRHRHTTAEWLNQARAEARVIKAQEDESAARRSAQLWTVENRRQQAVAAAAARQAARDRLTMRLLMAGIVIFGLALIIAGVFLAGR